MRRELTCGPAFCCPEDFVVTWKKMESQNEKRKKLPLRSGKREGVKGYDHAD